MEDGDVYEFRAKDEDDLTHWDYPAAEAQNAQGETLTRQISPTSAFSPTRAARAGGVGNSRVPKAFQGPNAVGSPSIEQALTTTTVCIENGAQIRSALLQEILNHNRRPSPTSHVKKTSLVETGDTAETADAPKGKTLANEGINKSSSRGSLSDLSTQKTTITPSRSKENLAAIARQRTVKTGVIATAEPVVVRLADGTNSETIIPSSNKRPSLESLKEKTLSQVLIDFQLDLVHLRNLSKKTDTTQSVMSLMEMLLKQSVEIASRMNSAILAKLCDPKSDYFSDSGFLEFVPSFQLAMQELGSASKRFLLHAIGDGPEHASSSSASNSAVPAVSISIVANAQPLQDFHAKIDAVTEQIQQVVTFFANDTSDRRDIK
eukprot:jgi/Hompol1/3124/HPOL_003127-RA